MILCDFCPVQEDSPKLRDVKPATVTAHQTKASAADSRAACDEHLDRLVQLLLVGPRQVEVTMWRVGD